MWESPAEVDEREQFMRNALRTGNVPAAVEAPAQKLSMTGIHNPQGKLWKIAEWEYWWILRLCKARKILYDWYNKRIRTYRNILCMWILRYRMIQIRYIGERNIMNYFNMFFHINNSKFQSRILEEWCQVMMNSPFSMGFNDGEIVWIAQTGVQNQVKQSKMIMYQWLRCVSVRGDLSRTIPKNILKHIKTTQAGGFPLSI